MALSCQEALTIAICIIYTLLTVVFVFKHSEGFDARRNKDRGADTQAREILGNRELFNPSKASYVKAKSQIKWLDPVIYYDTVRLANSNQLNTQNIKNQLRGFPLSFRKIF